MNHTFMEESRMNMSNAQMSKMEMRAVAINEEARMYKSWKNEVSTPLHQAMDAASELRSRTNVNVEVDVKRRVEEEVGSLKERLRSEDEGG